MATYQRIHFVINPAAGQPEPILSTINRVLHSRDVEWTVAVTLQDGDGQRLAQQAIEAGADLIVVYGGDGTVKDVVNGILEHDVPLAILHGGTGNALAYALGIPSELEQSVELIFDTHRLQSVDVGRVVCDDKPDEVGHFILRMSMGLQTKILETASREMKTQFGNLAYVVASIRELQESEDVTYQFRIDGEEIDGRGLTTLIANSAFIGGQANVNFAPQVKPDDGLLDVMVLDAGFMNTIQMIGSALQLDGVEMAQYWRGKEIKTLSPEGQLITLDGEVFGRTPATVTLLEQVVRVIVPVEG